MKWYITMSIIRYSASSEIFSWNRYTFRLV